MKICICVTVSLLLFFLYLIPDIVHAAEIHLCIDPVKGKSCTLGCMCPERDNVVFYKKQGSLSGEGVCVDKVCNIVRERYSLFRNLSGAYLNIKHLDREKDEDDWSCEYGVERSVSKTLTVCTRLSTLSIGKVPSRVERQFTVTAVGHCVYPNNVTANLLPSQGTSNHRPTIIYTMAPPECSFDEYNVSVSFYIKPSDFTGVVTFKVEVKGYGEEGSFVSDSSNAADFSDSESNTPVLFIALAIITFAVFIVVAWIISKIWYRQRLEAMNVRSCFDAKETASGEKKISTAAFDLRTSEKNVILEIRNESTTFGIACLNWECRCAGKSDKKNRLNEDVINVRRNSMDAKVSTSDRKNISTAGDTDPLLGKPNRTRTEKYNTLASPALFPNDTAMANRENDSTHIETNKHLTENLENQPSVVEINRKTPTINIEQSDKSDNLTTKVKFSADVDKRDPNVLRVGSHEESNELIQRTRIMYHMQMGIEHPPEQLSLCVKAEGKDIN